MIPAGPSEYHVEDDISGPLDKKGLIWYPCKSFEEVAYGTTIMIACMT